jgi:carbonic anhydrase/acetyltransferase-like protein (isoleucine patch superfamily)
MARQPNFNAVLEGATIAGYTHTRSGEHRKPGEMQEVIDGDEILSFDGAQYRVDSKGNLVGLDVELPKLLTIGYGVLVGAEVSFTAENTVSSRETVLLSGSSIYSRNRQQRIGAGLWLGRKSLLSATQVGVNLAVGDNARIYTGAIIGSYVEGGDNILVGTNAVFGDHISLKDEVEVGSGSVLGDSTSIDRTTRIGKHTVIEGGAIIGYETTIADNMRVGMNARIGNRVDTVRGLWGARDIESEEYVPDGGILGPLPGRRYPPSSLVNSFLGD